LPEAIRMPISQLKLIKRCVEYCPVEEIRQIPHNTRGLYALFKHHRKSGEDRYDVVYIGMARGLKSGVHSRLNAHLRSERKKDKWTHFSLFEVWDNITEAEVAELEGLFRHIYRKDTVANSLNVQKGFKKLTDAGKKKLDEWQGGSSGDNRTGKDQKNFLALARRFRATDDPKEVKRLREQMGRLVFGA
jgi:hypothetical protein